MANALTFNQISAVMNEIYQQATGRSDPAPVDTQSFVTQGQKALLAGMDPLLNSISQVLSRTIFSIRPYSRKFGGLEVDEIKWGNHVRKLTNADTPFENDDRYDLVDGEPGPDMFKVKKNKVLQTNFYGKEVFQFQSPTYFRDQLDVAFRGPDEFARYITMVMQNASDILEQGREGLARSLVCNLIGSRKSFDNGENVVHLVTEYNEYTGLSLDTNTVKEPENFTPFAKWCFARIRTLRDMMTERTSLFQTNIEGYEINRHTPLDRQKVYLLADLINHIDAEVLSSVYNEEFLRYGDHERVNFWQNPKDPYFVSVSPNGIDNQGNIISTPADEPVLVQNVVGVIFDEEAIGYTVANQWSGASPFQVRGGYYNLFHHETLNYWEDNTEKSVVLLLD